MAKQPNRKMIGLFMVFGIVGMAAILGALLQNKLFANKGGEVVMFFDESIKGLSVGSPVVFKGVKVGEVSKIEIVANTKDMSFSIPVYARMQKSALDNVGGDKNGKEVLQDLITKGLRARLVSQSYVTGQLMIDFEMLPDAPIVYHGSEKILEIPTTPSTMSELSKGLQEIPLAEGVRNFATFFRSLNNSMPKIDKTIDDLEKIVGQNKGAAEEVLNNFNNMVISVGKAANSLQNLTDYLEQHPEALLKGKR